jgi:hypothetical protein
MNDLLFAAATRMLGAANLDVQFAAAQALVPHLETLNPMALVQMHRIAGERALGPDVQLRLATAIVNYPMPPDLDLPAAFEHYPRPNPDFPLEVQRGAAQTLLQDQGVNPDQQRRAVEVMFNALDPALRIIPEEVPGLHLALQALTRPGVLQPGDPLLVRGVAVMEELRTAHPPVDPETQVTLAVAAINHPDMAPPNGMTPDLLRAVAQIIFDHPEGVAENVFQRAQQILNPQ